MRLLPNALPRAKIYEYSTRKIAKGGEKPTKSRDKIIALLSENGELSAVALAKKIGFPLKLLKSTLPTLKPIAS